MYHLDESILYRISDANHKCKPVTYGIKRIPIVAIQQQQKYLIFLHKIPYHNNLHSEIWWDR